MPNINKFRFQYLFSRSKLSPFITNFRNSPKKYLLPLLNIFLLCIISIFLWQIYKVKFPKSPPSQEPSPSPSPSSTSTPRPIPHGPIKFSVSQSDKTKPIISNGLIDPYDPDPDALQTITIRVRDIQPVTQVTAILKTDNSISTPISFQLIDGSPIDGTWQGSWTISDTYLYTYNLLLTATSSRGESNIEITLR